MPHFTSIFFFNDTATTEIYTLSLHDALPISSADVIDPAQRSAELLPAPLEHGLDESEEAAKVINVHRRRVAHVQQDKRRVDPRRGCEGRGWNRELDSGFGEHLHGDGGQARTARGRPSLRHLLLHHK